MFRIHRIEALRLLEDSEFVVCDIRIGLSSLTLRVLELLGI